MVRNHFNTSVTKLSLFQLCTSTTLIQVGPRPVSEEVSSFSSDEEQRLLSVLHGSSPESLHGLLYVVHPVSPRTPTWSFVWSMDAGVANTV